MRSILLKITGDPKRIKLERRIYNALTFFTPFATLFVLPLLFIIDMSVYHASSIIIICCAGFYLYYLSRFRNIKSDLFLIFTGLTLLSVIWISGYGSTGYVFLFYQFILFFSLLVLEKKPRFFFFIFITSIVIILVAAENFIFTPPKRYISETERTFDFIINFSVWFIFIGLIIKIIIDNYRIDRERLNHDLIVAQKLQMKLLPEPVQDIPGYSINAYYLPIDLVGGDFYDYTITGDNIYVMIADVSGHGLPGAFLATITKLSFDNEKPFRNPAVVLERVNKAILNSTVDANFVTVFFCSIDRRTNIMRCASAGHFPAILYRKESRTVETLKPDGKPLGWVHDPGFTELETILHPGDRLILYTDGITECCNGKGKLFGTYSLIELIKNNIELSPKDFIDTIITRLKLFCGADFFDDDITFLMVDISDKEQNS